MFRIAIVVGEPSGDILAARLMQGLKKSLPNAYFFGVGGQQMKAEGIDSWYEMERYTFMGLHQLLWRYLPLKRLQKKIILQLLQAPPDIFIGVDSSSFNLKIAQELKKNGIKTIQYVSPRVWAWRPERVHRIKKSVDKVLTLFSFEKDFFDQHGVLANYVGHPFADEIPISIDKNQYRFKYHFDVDDKILVVMPGSRGSDLKYMGPLFIQTMILLKEKMSHVNFVVPLTSEKLKNQFEKQLKCLAPNLRLFITAGVTREVLSMADAVLIKSGTGTLETLLMKKPMVVAYKTGYFTAKYVQRSLKLAYVSLPNILAGRKLVDEFLQDRANPVALAQACVKLLNDIKIDSEVITVYEDLHRKLRINNQQTASSVIINTLNT